MHYKSECGEDRERMQKGGTKEEEIEGKERKRELVRRRGVIRKRKNVREDRITENLDGGKKGRKRKNERAKVNVGVLIKKKKKRVREKQIKGEMKEKEK